MLKKIQPHRPNVSREVYTLRSISRAFPDGTWVEELGPSEELVATEKGSTPRHAARSGVNGGDDAPSITIIGGERYDKAAVKAFLFENDLLEHDCQVIVGVGRGVETDLAAAGAQVVELDEDRFGKKARDVNVEQTLCFAPNSPVLIVGNGTRAKQAKSWLKRASWPREVIYL